MPLGMERGFCVFGVEKSVRERAILAVNVSMIGADHFYSAGTCGLGRDLGAPMARGSGKLTSKTITAEHVALLAARDGLDLAAAKRQARRYAKELTGARIKTVCNISALAPRSGRISGHRFAPLRAPQST